MLLQSNRIPMRICSLIRLSVVGLMINQAVQCEELIQGRRSVVLEGPAAKLVVDPAGGSIVEFRLPNLDLNPLKWARPAPGDTAAHASGHFLCLDRWGAPSRAEG